MRRPFFALGKYWLFVILVLMVLVSQSFIGQRQVPSTTSNAENLRENSSKSTRAMRSEQEATRKAEKVAVAFTLTRDPGDNLQYIDMAAALVSQRGRISQKYEIEYVALLHPNVTDRTKGLLSKVGVNHLIVASFPIHPETYNRQKQISLNKGCCGRDELLKYHAWKLVDYVWVIHLDLDFVVLKSMDPLLVMPQKFLYTYDWAMSNPAAPVPQVQGGFLLLRPSMAEFQRINSVYETTPMFHGSGWNASGIGFAYGGATVQGFLPYYATHVMKSENHLVLDECVHNRMFERIKGRPACQPLPDGPDSFHFTACGKPWHCQGLKPQGKDHCKRPMQQWQRDIVSAARRVGLNNPENVGCVSVGNTGDSWEYHGLAQRLESL